MVVRILYDFDNATGRVIQSEKTLIARNSGESPYGVEFSQTSKKLYHF